MKKFVRIASDMYPIDGIESVNFNAVDGKTVEVKLVGVAETFRYTGEFADLAYAALSPLCIYVNDSYFLAHRIEWVNFEATIGGDIGVEVRVAGEVDAKGNPVTRQYTENMASIAYDKLTELVDATVAAS